MISRDLLESQGGIFYPENLKKSFKFSENWSLWGCSLTKSVCSLKMSCFPALGTGIFHLISQSHSPSYLAPSSQISLHQTSGLPLGFHRVLGSIKVLPFLRPIALSPFLLRNYLHVGLFILFKFKQVSSIFYLEQAWDCKTVYL